MATKLLEWVKTNKVTLTALGNVGVIYGLTVAPSTVGLLLYKRYYQLRIQDPQETTSNVCNPDSTLKMIIGQVKDDLKWDIEKKKNARFMITPSYEPYHKGSVSGINGSLISVPRYFMYYQPEQVDKVRSLSKGRLLTVLTKGRIERSPRVPVDWDSMDGYTLLNSLVLTNDEKRFVLMREMISCQSNSDHVIALLRIVTSTTSLGLMYYTREFMIQNVGMTFSMLAKRDLHSNGILTKMARGSLYMIILGTGLVTYYSMLSMYKNRREKQSDRTVAAMDRNYAEAGSKYYKRVLARNRACSRILGPKDGAYLFNSRGDAKSWIFRQETPVTERLAIMEDYVSKYSQEQKASTNNDDKTNAK